uniref:Cyclin-K isoform X2 n=1 Tax=Drosophila rhopaloa TaxID=1041015 RepID=A0A6P4E0U0_DRORH
MPCWYYDKKELRETPSILDGISFEMERRYRKEGARFIMECGTKMGLGHNTMATGVVYFHRFYMFHSFRSFPRYVTACCCLFFAGKVEETPKKCRDIIKMARGILNDNYFYSFGEDPKEEVEHPYTFLLKYAKCFKGDQQKLQKMVQMAWNFVNDSLSTVVCLQWEPEIIAVALIHLASKLSKFTVQDWEGRQPQHQRWWDMFVSDVTMEILEDICHQVLDLYQSTQKEGLQPSSPPQKPPSRADSPTAVKPPNPLGILPSAVQQQQAPPSASGNGSLLEVSNIQSIKTLASGVPIMCASSSPCYQSVSQGPTPLGQTPGYHLYHAPPPPPPPVVPLPAYPSSSWAVQQPPPTHYAGGAVPPPPMPPNLPSGPSGYYSTSGRQPQQRYQ